MVPDLRSDESLNYDSAGRDGKEGITWPVGLGRVSGFGMGVGVLGKKTREKAQFSFWVHGLGTYREAAQEGENLPRGAPGEFCYGQDSSECLWDSPVEMCVRKLDMWI